MGLRRQITQYGTARLARRVGRSVPLLGAALALFGLRYAIRRKGLWRGVVDSSLDAVPGVGAAKNVYEAVRGDIIPDRTRL
ncbi:MAG: hypothetical protein H0V80_15670 [Acidobacteria bacterium]|nr:hypothetical protein [Acidobacteriota bacterium]